MKLGILQTDSVRPELSGEFGEYPDMFSRLLRRVEPNISFKIFDVQKSEYPSNIDEVDAYLITGSKLSVFEDFLWIQRLKQFIQTLDKNSKKLIGICFGHQLIADALGGKTVRSKQGWCAGVHTARICDSAQLFFETDQFNLISNHQDQVSIIPPGAEVLASTPSCPVSMMRIDNHILTLQGHPEFEKNFTRKFLGLLKDIIGEPLYREAINSLSAETDEQKVSGWIISFLSD